MATKLTNRIVGALALLAIAVIVLPELLSGKQDAVVEQADEIPLAPQLSRKGDAELAQGAAQLAEAQQQNPAEATRELPDDPDSSVDALLNTPLQEGQTGAAEGTVVAPSVVVTTPVRTEKPLPGHSAAAYSVQLGVFSNAANVAALVKKVRAAGYKVYTIPAQPVDGKPTKVLVGPQAERDAAERLLAPLATLTGVSGRVVVYDPLAP